MKKRPLPWSDVGLAALVVLAIVVACHKSTPTGPSGTAPTNGPPVAPTATPTALRIDGPASIAPGASAQYRLIATFSDGTSEDVTSRATWRTYNSSVLVASPGGIVQARSRGESALDAVYSNRSAHVYVLVLEDGTYRLTGRVTESGGGLRGARVDVVGGTGSGLNALSGPDGSYVLYGVAGEVLIEVGLDGFERSRQTIIVGGNMNVDLALRPTAAPTDLSGTWRLTLNAASGCTPTVPEDAATRSYNATVQQTGTFFRIELRSPTIPKSEVRLEGTVIDKRLTMFLPADNYDYYGVRYYYYSLVETLEPTRVLGIGGTARGERTGAVVSGTLEGDFSLYAGGDASGVTGRYFSCTRSDHTFRLDRN